jgi:hypothetical protein
MKVVREPILTIAIYTDIGKSFAKLSLKRVPQGSDSRLVVIHLGSPQAARGAKA